MIKSSRIVPYALAGLLLTGASPLALAAETAPAGMAVPRLNYQERHLANGLTVYSVRDTTTPNVAIQVWYGVGSKDDPKGRSGFAHLFEHMMFKSTRDLPPESFDRLTEDVGGNNNASTNDDYTDYFETVPANHLQRLLWAEAERMGSLVVDEANFKSERDVVKEELRQRVLAAPYGRLFYLMFPEVSFQVHPYGRPGIGSIEDLDAATLKDVQAFHATYYRPDNATLVVVGNFDQAQLDAWVDAYLGKVPRPATPLPRVTAVEPPHDQPRTYTTYQPNVPLPAVLVSYPLPAITDKDAPALTVLDAILSRGDSSRLNQALVYQQQVATEALTFEKMGKQPGAYAIGAILSGGTKVEAGESALLAEVERVRRDGVTAAEVAAAKNQIVTDELQERETIDGRAHLLANAAVLMGDASRADGMLADIQAVTPEDVARVARTWLVPERRTVIHYLPEEAGKTGDTIAVSARIDAAPLAVPADMAVVEPAPADQRVAPPPPAAPVAVTLPQPVERRLDNGLRVVVVPTQGVGLVEASLRVGGGGAVDPAALPGLASLTADVLTKGTATRSAPQIARDVESLGGSLGGSAGWDGSSLELSVKADALTPAMAVFADVIQHPAFAAAELDRERHQALDGLTVSLKSPAGIARLAGARVLYGDGAYGHALTGTPKSLKAIKAADLKAYHQTWWRPDNATLVLAGSITPEAGFTLAQDLLGGWTAPKTPLPALPTVTPRSGALKGGGHKVLVIDLPKSGQAAVLVTRPGLARSDRDYYVANVANAILGGGYSSRLNEEIRVKRGLSYGAGSSLDFRRQPGPFSASTQTKNVSAPEVADLILGEMGRLATAPITPDELAARKAVLVGGFGRTVERASGVAGVVGSLALQGVDLGELNHYIEKVEAVDADAVHTVAARTINPDAASVVIVGDAGQFLPALKKQFPAVEVIPAAKLNLDSKTLK